MFRSLATTDCAKWLNGYGVGSRFDGTHPSRIGKGPIIPNANCRKDNDISLVTMEDKQFCENFFAVQTKTYDAARGWFFWTYKTEGNYAWDYSIGMGFSQRFAISFRSQGRVDSKICEFYKMRSSSFEVSMVIRILKR